MAVKVYKIQIIITLGRVWGKLNINGELELNMV